LEGERIVERGKMCLVAFFVLLAFALAFGFIGTVFSADETVLSVDPPWIEDAAYEPGTSINVGVVVANVTDLRFAAFNLSFDPEILDCVGWWCLPEHSPVPNEVVIGDGFTWFNITYGSPITTTSPVVLVNMTFNVLAHGHTTLELSDTVLQDSDQNSIPHVTADGYFNNFNPYDLNQDGIVDIRDIAIVAAAFGSYPGHPRWNPVADVDGDGYVTIKDLTLVAAHFGEH